jgi:hypothetical protein
MAERGRDPHISAIEAIYGALKALDPATRRKVLASVSALIDVGEIPAGEQARSAVICVRIDQRRLNPGFMPTVRGESGDDNRFQLCRQRWRQDCALRCLRKQRRVTVSAV